MNTNRLFHLVCALILVALLAGCGPTTTPAAPTSAPPAPTKPPTAPTTPAPPAQTKPPAAPTTPAPPAPIGQDATVSLTWYGQSTFVLTTSTGLKALLDPTGPGTGYKIPTLDGIDLVTISHEHSDHNAVNLASGNPLVLRGLAGNDWAKIDQTVKGVRVRTVGVYHDDAQGSKRGKNSIFIFDVDGLRVAHLGDLGHPLSPEQIKDVGAVDVILIPVGGYYTIDAKTAVEVVSQLNPTVVVPMHYKTADLSASLATVLAPVDDFVKAIGSTATVSEVGQTITIERGKLPAARTVMLIKYK
jgi:L-ascorbate metabolism protein UlaG (beta-lactamase superfamily)